MKKSRIERIKKAIFERPYVFSFIGIFIIYIAINLIINKLYVNFYVFNSFVLWFRIPFLLFNFLIVPSLVALTINLSILRFKEAGVGKHTGIIGLGAFGGILGGACPGCFVGLFPAFLGLFGLTATLSILPFYGLEIQAASTLLLLVAINLLTRDVICKV
ncbi:MAG: hypothetical protein KatS3mg001_033 [Candidatus Pacearchaeota archaeon]|nr:MAG: hypothetical protein KatS3mg001_033 [Candidatus Pacearchaeota archaeon]